MDEMIAAAPADNQPLSLEELMTEIAIALVDIPEEVIITESGTDTTTSLLTIKVATGDVSKILGKQGTTIKALRELFSKIAAARGRRAIVEIIDPRKTRDH
jgi:predicted RNA-binding protein YlqC (UPF0109 family)